MPKGPIAPKKKNLDNLEAAQIVRDAIKDFSKEQQTLILRWAAESIGIPADPILSTPQVQKPPALIPPVSHTVPSPSVDGAPRKQGKDIATFVNEKKPISDIHLATTIAYYYRFEAPDNEQREEIDSKFLRDACRKAGRPGQLTDPGKTLNNALAKGLLDKGSTKGKFSINTVGENLVGMTLPSVKGK